MSARESTLAIEPPGGGGKRALAALRKFVGASWVGAASLAVLLVVIGLAVIGGRIAPYDPLATDFGATQQPPSARHLLGTDRLGRDVLSRLVVGTRTTMVIALASIAIGDTIGFFWGLTSGYLGRRFDIVSQRLLDLLMAFPALILAMLLLTGLGSGLHTVIIAIAVTRIPLTTRVVRSVVLAVKEMAYIEAARAVGVTSPRIMAAHVAPQCVAPLLVIASFNLGTAIFAEAALSFLGLGAPPPAPSWGSMLGSVLAESFKPPWWLVIVPGLAITLTIASANLLGDALRDFLDPRLRSQVQ
jgi:ABC-type dipeptide/oligopeptide/nickel transport system permease subunit